VRLRRARSNSPPFARRTARGDLGEQLGAFAAKLAVAEGLRDPAVDDAAGDHALARVGSEVITQLLAPTKLRAQLVVGACVDQAPGRPGLDLAISPQQLDILLSGGHVVMVAPLCRRPCGGGAADEASHDGLRFVSFAWPEQIATKADHHSVSQRPRQDSPRSWRPRQPTPVPGSTRGTASPLSERSAERTRRVRPHRQTSWRIFGER